jgi:serine/threonine protein kinase/TolB-like protein/tetratricopeptide (TPR) repeat protein
MALSVAQMARMSRLLDEALGLDESGRRQWLEVLAPEDQDLEGALWRALLPDGQDGAQAPATLPRVGLSAPAPEVATLRPGDRVGPYQLVRELGSGGMAEVWLAQRADGAFKREVALKLPALARLRKDLASRFARERDILASLEHPNIARLYDAGVSAEGLPYLAMEYVAGQPLTTWCDAHRLGIRERLKLCLQVLDAVQYAHGHQVLHRDIKPSNILVTESGQVRLLDFGVAKLLEQEEHTELTQVYGRALTPEYASPELLRGERVDAATDIYALGVLLYELLAGSRPYRLQHGASLTAIEQAVMQAQVQRPSTRVAPDTAAARAMTVQKLSRRLRGDLDAIVLKTLARDSKDRYPSAEALADDLQRHLSGETVAAQPDRLSYRLSKFMLRHKAGTALAATAAVLATVAAGYTLTRSPGAEPAAAAKNDSSASGTATVAADVKSIAVLPFSTSTLGDGEKWHVGWFARDLSVTLGRTLSHFGWPVIASSVSATEAGLAEMQRVSRELSARYLISGELHRSGDQIAVDMRIVDGSSGTQAWAGRIETPEARVAQSTDLALLRATAVLRHALYKIEERRIVSGPLQRLTPAELVIRADAIIISTDQDRETVDRLYAQARVRDPNGVPALVGAAYRLCCDDEPSTTDAERRLRDADDLSRRAIGLAPEDAVAWYARAWILWHQYRFDAALAAIAKSIQIDPSYAKSYVSRAVFTLSIGQPETALPMLDRARDIDSTVDGVASRVACRAFLSLGRYDEAVQSCERAMATDESWLVHLYLTAAYAQKGDMARAADAKARLLNRKPGFTIATLKEPKDPPDSERFREQWEKHITAGLRKAGIPER